MIVKLKVLDTRNHFEQPVPRPTQNSGYVQPTKTKEIKMIFITSQAYMVSFVSCKINLHCVCVYAQSSIIYGVCVYAQSSIIYGVCVCMHKALLSMACVCVCTELYYLWCVCVYAQSSIIYGVCVCMHRALLSMACVIYCVCVHVYAWPYMVV